MRSGRISIDHDAASPSRIQPASIGQPVSERLKIERREKHVAALEFKGLAPASAPPNLT
jgi:hypothetical protein